MPLDALPHNNLGVHLSASGDSRGAGRAFREAIRLRPDYPEAHSNLGTELRRQGDLAGAVDEHKEAVRLKPDSAIAHLNLGAALGDSGNLPGAVLEFREATRLAPEDPDAHCNLGHALRDLGQFPQALAAMERGHAIGMRQPRWSSPSADWVKECRRLVELERKLPKIVSGQDRPADATERADLALVAHAKGLHAAAARLFIEAFAERPALADDLASGRRYNAACDAALAGCGKGRDEPPPGPADCARLRTQALNCLKADLAAWARRLDASPTTARAEVAQNLRHWRIDVDLTGVRNPAEIAKLPERRASGMAGFLGRGRSAIAEGGEVRRTSVQTARGGVAGRPVRVDPHRIRAESVSISLPRRCEPTLLFPPTWFSSAAGCRGEGLSAGSNRSVPATSEAEHDRDADTEQGETGRLGDRGGIDGLQFEIGSVEREIRRHRDGESEVTPINGGHCPILGHREVTRYSILLGNCTSRSRRR